MPKQDSGHAVASSNKLANLGVWFGQSWVASRIDAPVHGQAVLLKGVRSSYFRQVPHLNNRILLCMITHFIRRRNWCSS